MWGGGACDYGSIKMRFSKAVSLIHFFFEVIKNNKFRQNFGQLSRYGANCHLKFDADKPPLFGR